MVMQVRMRGTVSGGEKSVAKCGAVGGLSWEKFFILSSIGWKGGGSFGGANGRGDFLEEIFGGS